MIRKLSFDGRDTTLDFAPLPVKGFREITLETLKSWMLHAFGPSVSNTNRIFCFQIAQDIQVIFQRIEAFVEGKSFDLNPRRFFSSNRLELPRISRWPKTHVLTENEKCFFFDQDHVFDIGTSRLLALYPQAFPHAPLASKIVRSCVGKPIARAVAQSVASSFQGLFQILEKKIKQLLEGLCSKPPVKLLKRGMVWTLAQAQKFPEPWVRLYLFLGLTVCPFVVSSQKKQSQKLALPICFLRKLTRIIFHYLLAKIKTYQKQLLVAGQLFHGSSSYPKSITPGGAFV